MTAKPLCLRADTHSKLHTECRRSGAFDDPPQDRPYGAIGPRASAERRVELDGERGGEGGAKLYF